MEEIKLKIINIGILAHVDAGKTTLTESLLYSSGAIKELGSVDSGTTKTDTMFLERQRGITIQTAITSFQRENVKVNIVDTPGHMDFLADVYRSLSVLDGAILLISAKDGVQSQTRILFHALRKMNIPIIFFINKIDQNGINLHSPLILFNKVGKTILYGTGTTSDGWFIKLWVVAKHPKIVFATYQSERKSAEVKVCDSIIDSFQFAF